MRFSKLILFGLLLFGVPAAQAQNPLRQVFPTAVANDQTMGVACNSAHTTLLASIGSTSTSLSVNNSSQFCTPAWITIDGGTVNVEVIQIRSAAGFTLNVCTNGRGVHGAAIGHSVGAAVDAWIDQSYINQAAAEIEGIEGALGASLENVLLPTGMYANPPWLTSVAWSKIASVPANVTNAAGTNQSNTYTAGTQNFSGAAHTLPTIVVSTSGGLPGTCTVGELAFVTGATAGQQIYECSAINTWTQQTGQDVTINRFYSQVLTDFPVAFFEFQDAYDSSIYADSSGNGYNLTPVNGHMLPVLQGALVNAIGVPGGEFTLGGSMQASLSSGLQTAWPIGNTLSIEAIFRVDGPEQGEYSSLFDIGSASNSNNDRVGIDLFQGQSLPQPYFVLGDSSGSGCSLPTLVGFSIHLPFGQWFHIVGTYDGATCKFYFDGQLVSSTSVSITVSPVRRSYGGLWTTTRNDTATPASIQALVLYNTTLSPTRIAQHYSYILGQ